MNILILILTARTYPYQKNGDCFKGAIPMVWQLQPHNRRPDANRNVQSSARVSIDAFWGGEYLDFPIEGNSIKNDGLS